MKRLLLVLCVLGLSSQAYAATTLTTDGGQTITFANSTIGTYANGDYWILVPSGSLTITRTSPAPSGGQNGCEVDFPNLPVWDGNHGHNGLTASNRTHGFDSRQFGYAASQNSCTTSTVIVATNHTLMLGKSRATGQIFSNGSNVTHYIELIEPVTLVSTQPASGDFRPGFAATSKASPGNKSTIDYTRLNNWSAASITGEPSQGQAETLMRYIIYQGTIRDTQWQNMAGTKNTGYNSEFGVYGRNIGAAVVDVLTFLNVSNSNAVKETMAVRWIQQAIDIVAQHNAGFRFQNVAGHVWPQKAIVLVAASLMNNQTWADTVKTSVVGQHWWDDDQIYFTVTQTDIDTARVFACSDNNHTDPNQCQAFVQGDLGKAYWCDNYFDYASNGADCSRVEAPNYSWIASHHVPIAFMLSKLSLLEEFDNSAYYGYLMASNSVRSNWAYPTLSTANSVTTAWGLCTYSVATVTSANGMKTYACSLIANHINDTAVDGSLTGGSPPNQAPSLSLTTPSSSLSQTTTAATIALSGTSSDSDGTVSSVVATADCDASVAATGTVSAWTRTVDLPAATACTVTIVATDDDAATTTIVVSVLRSTGTCTGLADTFALSGTWPTLNPNCWTQMIGNLSWTNNRAQSASAARNFFYYNSPIANDQQSAFTVDFLPAASNWAYAGVRGGVSGSAYSGYGCTAENPTSKIYRYDAGIATQLGSVATTWVQGQTLGCSATGTSICLLQNAVQQGSCATDSTYSSGFAFAGLWGLAGALDNFVATALSGGGDVIPPVVAFTTPSTNPLIVTTQPYTLAAGTASDAVGVATCTWLVVEFPSANGSCGGTALPNTSVSWTIASIALSSTGLAQNTVQVTVADAAGNTATTSTVVRYIPGGPGGSWTYPNTESAWTQKGRVVQLEGTFQAGVCDYVRVSEVTDPTTGVGPVIATGTDTWVARVAVPPGTTNVIVSCMDDSGTGGVLTDDVSLLDRIKVVTSIKSRQRR